jgi:hypothetical protein
VGLLYKRGEVGRIEAEKRAFVDILSAKFLSLRWKIGVEPATKTIRQ